MDIQSKIKKYEWKYYHSDNLEKKKIYLQKIDLYSNTMNGGGLSGAITQARTTPDTIPEIINFINDFLMKNEQSKIVEPKWSENFYTNLIKWKNVVFDHFKNNAKVEFDSEGNAIIVKILNDQYNQLSRNNANDDVNIDYSRHFNTNQVPIHKLPSKETDLTNFERTESESTFDLSSRGSIDLSDSSGQKLKSRPPRFGSLSDNDSIRKRLELKRQQ